MLNNTGNANQVLYKNSSNVATTSPNLTFDGSSLSAATFVGNLTGTATTATNANNINISATTSSDTSTSVVLVANQSTGNQSPFIDSGLTYNANTDALTATTFNGNLNGSAITLGTEISLNTISGATTTITDIPTWAKKITIMFDNVTMITTGGAGKQRFFVKLLTSSGSVSQYESTSTMVGDGEGSTTQATDGFVVSLRSKVDPVHGHMTITLMGSNTASSSNNKWISSHTVTRYAGDSSAFGAGRLSVQSITAVDRIQFLPDFFGETAGFTSGTVNVMFE